MNIFGSRDPSFGVADYEISPASDADLENWGSDPNCRDREKCLQALAARRAWKEQARTAKLQVMAANPFDPRTDVSADAKYVAAQIVKHL
jgi:hypothetical protein